MDFGLDKLVEMIEQRFGRLAGTVVLAAVGVAAFAFAIHAVFSYLIVPAFRYAPTIFGSLGVAWARMSLADGIHAALQLLIGTLAAIVFVAVSRVFQTRHVKKIQAGMRQSARDLESLAEDCRAFTEKNHAGLDAHAHTLAQQCDELVQNALAQANALMAEAAERMGEAAPRPITIEDIGPRLAQQKEEAAAAAAKMRLPSES